MRRARKKLHHFIRLNRAVRFVWQAGPRWVVCSAGLVFLQGVLPLAALYLMKLIVDSVTLAVRSTDSGAAFREVLFYIAMAGIVAVIQASLSAISGLVRESMGLTVGDRMYDILHKKSIAVDLDYYENPKYFDTLHRAQREGPFRPMQIVNTLISLGQSSISLIAMAGLLLSFHWAITLLLFVAAVPGILVRINFSRVMFGWQRDKTPDERRAMYYNWILTGSIHAKEVRLFGIGDEIADRFSRVRQTLRHEKLSISRKRVLADFIAQAFGSLVVFATFSVIAFRAVSGAISLGDLVMFYQAFQRGMGSLRGVLQGLANLYENNLFLSYLYDFLDVQPQVQTPDAPVPMPRIWQQGVCFDRVWFGYPNTGKMVLKDISFDIKPGEVVALVGENGSGKTTLVKLLCRFYDPCKGQITVDDISLDRFEIDILRRELSVIFQDFVKYDLTVDDNIRFGRIDLPAADTKSVRQAAEKAGADKIIKSLPNEYQTILGKLFQDGVELSIGQWQMIALARAFIGNSSLIVLDEPTSSLDPKREYEIFSRFRDLIKNKSAVLISHRFSTVKMADRILVLKNGRLVEQGSHGDLMKKNGYYADLFKKQSACYQA